MLISFYSIYFYYMNIEYKTGRTVHKGRPENDPVRKMSQLLKTENVPVCIFWIIWERKVTQFSFLRNFFKENDPGTEKGKWPRISKLNWKTNICTDKNNQSTRIICLKNVCHVDFHLPRSIFHCGNILGTHYALYFFSISFSQSTH